MNDTEKNLTSINSYKNEIYVGLMNLKEHIEIRIIQIQDIKDEKEASEELKKSLMILSDHLAGFMSAICFDIMQDPENWLKHTFYESLKHIQYRRKDAIDSLVKSGQKSTLEH